MLIGTAFLLAVSPLRAQEVDVGIRLREWFVRYDGAVTADGRQNNGTRLDAASDLGLDSYEFAHDVELSVDLPNVGRFSGGYWRLRLEGDETLAGDANFDGSIFPAGTAMESRLAFDVLYVDYEVPLVRDPLQLGFVAGVRYLSGEADFEGGGMDEHANLNRPLLFSGVHVGAQFNPGFAGTRRSRAWRSARTTSRRDMSKQKPNSASCRSTGYPSALDIVRCSPTSKPARTPSISTSTGLSAGSTCPSVTGSDPTPRRRGACPSRGQYPSF